MPKTATPKLAGLAVQDERPVEEGAGLRNFNYSPMVVGPGEIAYTPNTNLKDEFQELKNRILPVNIRSYASHIFGNRSPITEKNLTREDLNTLQYAVNRYPDVSKGYIDYGDYSPDGPSDIYKNWSGQTPSSIILNSYTNPAYRMETTLGKASFRRLPDGSTIVEDNYNFNPSTQNFDANAVRQQNLIAILKEAIQEQGIINVLNMIGNIYGNTANEEGTPVSIRLPPQTTVK